MLYIYVITSADMGMDNPICSVYESFKIYCCAEQAGGAEEEREQIPSLQFFKLFQL